MSKDFRDERRGRRHVHIRHGHARLTGALVHSLGITLLRRNRNAGEVRARTEFWRITGCSRKISGKRQRSEKRSQKKLQSAAHKPPIIHPSYFNGAVQRETPRNFYISGVIGGSCTLAGRFSLVPRRIPLSYVYTFMYSEVLGLAARGSLL